MNWNQSEKRSVHVRSRITTSTIHLYEAPPYISPFIRVTAHVGIVQLKKMKCRSKLSREHKMPLFEVMMPICYSAICVCAYRNDKLSLDES